jgi:tricorn protease
LPAYAEPSGEAPRWLRFASIAPDGETIAFTHRGQIFVVPSDGGLAVPISSQKAYSHNPVWSSDSEQLAFASDIAGNDDVYITDFSGDLKRLTFSSADELPASFAPDNASVLYEANRLGDGEASVQGALSGRAQLYQIALDTGREGLVLPNQAQQAHWNTDKSRLVYSYDPSSDPRDRQVRVAANARQLWTFDPVSGHHERLFEVDGVDRNNPLWGPDGATLYYLSEKSGHLNVWSLDLASGTETQLTDYSDDPVRFLSVADNGSLAYTYRGRIYVKTADAEVAEPIEILTLEQVAHDPVNMPGIHPQGFKSAPNGKLFAHIVDTDVFLGDLKGNIRRATNTPGEERGLNFAPDSSMLVYAAQRDHKWGIYVIDLSFEDGKSQLANTYSERALVVPEDGNAQFPEFSPDGTKISFWSDRRELKLYDLETAQVTTLFTDGNYNSTYFDGHLTSAWSPNSKQLLVDWNTADASGLRRVAIVNADGEGLPQPIGNLADFGNYIWSDDGTQLIGFTTLYSSLTAKLDAQSQSLYRIFLSEDARHDFLDAHDEVISAPDSPESETESEAVSEAKVYSVASHRPRYLEGPIGEDARGGIGLFSVSPTTVFTVGYADDTLTVDALDLTTGETEEVLDFPAEGLLSLDYLVEAKAFDLQFPGHILRVPIANPAQAQKIEQTILYTRDDTAARLAAFEQAWADIKYRYYDPAIEGRDWDAIGEKYRAYVPSVASNRELASLLSAMFGEISASHLYVHYSGNESDIGGLGTHEDSIGAYLDYGYTGPGRRIAAVLPNGPLDRRSLGVNAGDVIVSVNGQTVPDAGGLDRLLDLNVGRQVQLGILDEGAGQERTISVKPMSVSEEGTLANARLIDARAEKVQQLSNSCIAYQYIPAMDNDAYIDVLATLSAQRDTAKAALIDVRSNGGGNLTRELITMLTGEAYSITGRDDGAKVIEPNNRWNWPSAIVVDSFSYSDGSVFPQAYQDMDIGKIVGDTVLNTGTAVNYVRSAIIPGLTYGIPVLPLRRMDGTYYENNIIEPDIHVPFDPNNAGIGVDPQLEAAVAALMEQIGTDSDCRLLQ